MHLVFENIIGQKQIVSTKKENYLFLLLLPGFGTFIVFMISVFKGQAKNVVFNYLIYSFVASFIFSFILVMITSNNGVTDTEVVMQILEDNSIILFLYNSFVAGLFAILYSPYLNILKVRTLVKKKYVLLDKTEGNNKYVQDCLDLKIPFYIFIK